jgi:hypothetical protein
MKEKPTVGLPYFGVFPSDHIPKATKDINVYFFIHNKKSCKLYHQISVNYISKFWKILEATTYSTDGNEVLQYRK